MIPPTTGPKITQLECRREELPGLYAEVLQQNPLLGRLEGKLRAIGWTDEEIRTVQLLAACKSNASLMQRLKEIETSLGRRC